MTQQKAVYYPGYSPKNPEKFAAMHRVLSNCESKEDLEKATLLYTMDLSFEREDILVAAGRVAANKGWTL